MIVCKRQYGTASRLEQELSFRIGTLGRKAQAMRTECISDFVSLGGKTYPCPISVAMDLVGGKWKAVILYHLQHGPKRFGELRRALISPTEAVLSNQLRQLERDGLVSREVFGSKPPVKTVYSLTEFGRTFLPALTALTEWGNRVVCERGRFE